MLATSPAAAAASEATRAGALLERVEAATGRKGPAAALVDFANALGSMQKRRPQERLHQSKQLSSGLSTVGKPSPRPSVDSTSSNQGGVMGCPSVFGKVDAQPLKTFATKGSPLHNNLGLHLPSPPRSARVVRGKTAAAAATAVVTNVFASKELIAQELQREQKQRSRELKKQHQQQLQQLRELQELLQEPTDKHHHLDEVFEPLRMMKRRMALHIGRDEGWDVLASERSKV